MFSNWASYLLGYGETYDRINNNNGTTSPQSDNIRLSTVETEDDDWLMVEATRRDPSTSRNAGSRSSSTSSLPTCLSLEESWFVTPPPCFTSTGSVTVETSPMENLLIEHPSMSVYDRSGLTFGGHRLISMQQQRRRQQQERQEQQQQEAESQAQRARSLSPTPAAQVQTRFRRIPLQPNYHHNLQVKAFNAQKQQSTKECQMLKSKQLDRTYKVRDVNKRNKRQRRSDRQKNHSGANNNRKCC